MKGSDGEIEAFCDEHVECSFGPVSNDRKKADPKSGFKMTKAFLDEGDVRLHLDDT